MASKILLADDSITIQKVVELTFSDAEYEVSCISDGMQVLDRVRETRPDIVLLDVILPGENGYDICDGIKSDPTLSSIPVLLLTGTFEPFDRQRAEAAGADGHLTKPFESQVLVAKVNELLKSVRRLQVSQDDGVARIINTGEEYKILTPDTLTGAPRSKSPAAASPPKRAATPSPKLDDAAMERIVRLVSERIGERVIREIAWEVIPKLAEELVRQRIREIEEEAD